MSTALMALMFWTICVPGDDSTIPRDRPPDSCDTNPESQTVKHALAHRPVSTYSIVARDPESGYIGVGVQSHWFSVGSVCPWAEAGVGAVSTQSLVDPTYGRLGLALMGAGRSAPEALRALLAADDGGELRQVGMIDARGRVAAHTGEKCIAEAGHIVDTEGQFAVHANLMGSAEVWPEMARAYSKHEGDLADRIVAALEAAEAAGGDIRGRQSAALIVVRAEPTGKPWYDRIFDLRIEDHPEPVQELKRLVRLQRAYLHMNAGDEAIEEGDFEKAREKYAAARKLAPHIVEIPFWQAVTMVSSGKVAEALPLFKEVFAREPRWIALIPRLAKVGLLPEDKEIIDKITAQKVNSDE